MAPLSLIEKALLFYGTCLPNHPRKWWIHNRLRDLLGVSLDRDFELVREELRWSLNPADFEHAGLFWLGTMDRWDLHHVRRLVAPGCVFIDVGANFGYYSLMLAKALKLDCQVHAFEPTPTTYQRLLRHIEWNDMANIVHAHAQALADVPGTATLIQRPDNSGASRLGNDAEGIPVSVTTLDAFCETHAIKQLDLIKIDVEGYEARVLCGAESTLSHFKPALVVEFWTTGAARAGSTVDEIADMLRRFGYHMYKISRHQLIPINEPPRTEIPENIFCFHTDRQEEMAHPTRIACCKRDRFQHVFYRFKLCSPESRCQN